MKKKTLKAKATIPKEKYSIYLSGQITGLFEVDALRNFIDAEVQASRFLIKVLPKNVQIAIINPMTLKHKKNANWEDYMVKDISELFKCQAIFMLNNWTNSKGARIERAIAHEMGITILYQK